MKMLRTCLNMTLAVERDTKSQLGPLALLSMTNKYETTTLSIKHKISLNNYVMYKPHKGTVVQDEK